MAMEAKEHKLKLALQNKSKHMLAKYVILCVHNFTRVRTPHVYLCACVREREPDNITAREVTTAEETLTRLSNDTLKMRLITI